MQRLQVIANTAGMEQLYEVRTLRLHPLDGDRIGFYAIKLTGFDRLIISYESATQTVWIEEVSKHYGD
jgi:proteic killer suppression protein